MTYRTALLLILAGTLLDSIIWGLTEEPFAHFSRAIFYTLVTFHAPALILAFAVFLAMLPLFLLTGLFGTDLLIFAPLGALYYLATDKAYFPSYARVIAVSLAGLVHLIGMERFIGGVPLTGRAFLASFLSALCMVYLTVGSQGNRSRK